MIRVEHEDQGFEGFVEELMAESREDAEGGVRASVVHLERRAKDKVAGNRTGRTYFVPGEPNATYTASSPGEPPASASGQLRTAIQHTAPEWTGDEVESRVGVDLQRAPYARRLEFGGTHVMPRDVTFPTPDGFLTVRAGTVIRIAPRPWLRPTFQEEEGAVDGILREWMP